jgi:hypothetical protein
MKGTTEIKVGSDGERGWVCTSEKYGVWFLPFEAVRKNKAEALKNMDGDKANLKISDSDVVSWFAEQCGWLEVAELGVQRQRPDMAAWEKRFYEEMKNDPEPVDDLQTISI